MKPKRHLKLLRNLLILLLLLIGAGLFAVLQYYKGIVKQKLPGIVARATKNAYRCSVSDVSINLLSRKVTLYDLRLWYDSSNKKPRPALSGTVTIPELKVSGIRIGSLLSGKELDCADVLLRAPDLKLVYSAVRDSTVIKEKRSPGLEKIHIGTLRLEQLRFRAEIRDSIPAVCTIEGAGFRLRDWTLSLADTNIFSDSTRVLMARQLEGQLQGIHYRQQGALYTYDLDTLDINSSARELELKGLAILPAVSKKDFYKAVGHEKDLFRVRFGHIRLQQIAFHELMAHQRVLADTMQLDDGAVHVYFSRLPSADPKSKLGRFPNQMLLKLPLTISIPYARVRNGAASYTEVSEETELPGALPFTALKGTIRNLSNDSEQIARDPHCVVDLSGYFMKRSPVQARFDFLMNNREGVFTVDGLLEKVSAPQVTDAALALGKVSLDQVEVQSLKMHISGDQHQASGRFTFLYRDLAINVKKVDKETKEVKDKPLLSFVANRIFLYPANPMPGKEVRTADTHIERDPNKSFFNLIWRNIFDGIKLTAARNEDLIKALGKKKK